jgi:hypothetical protein
VQLHIQRVELEDVAASAAGRRTRPTVAKASGVIQTLATTIAELSPIGPGFSKPACPSRHVVNDPAYCCLGACIPLPHGQREALGSSRGLGPNQTRGSISSVTREFLRDLNPQTELRPEAERNGCHSAAPSRPSSRFRVMGSADTQAGPQELKPGRTPAKRNQPALVSGSLSVQRCTKQDYGLQAEHALAHEFSDATERQMEVSRSEEELEASG